MNYSTAELMAIVLARTLSEGDVVLTGTNAAIPTAAYRTAQRLGVDGLVAVNGALGTVDPSAAVVPDSSADEDLLTGRFSIGLPEIVRGEVRGLFDVVFLGAMQIDRHGQLNLVCVGDYDHPTVRGPGTLGLSMVAVIDRTLIYLTRHDPRTFVEAVDFVSSRTLRDDGRGLGLIVTPLAVLGPTPARDRVDVVSVHPGVDPDFVAAQTGFALEMAAATETPEPTARELEALRAVDSTGTLRDMSLPR
jgi:glutaconate CoA-transferase, subunit B